MYVDDSAEESVTRIVKSALYFVGKLLEVKLLIY